MCDANRSMPLARHAWVHGGVALRRQSCSQDQQRHARERGDHAAMAAASKYSVRVNQTRAGWCVRQREGRAASHGAVENRSALVGSVLLDQAVALLPFRVRKLAKNDLQKQTYVFSLAFQVFRLDFPRLEFRSRRVSSW
jgi:hypothetical protein